MDLGLADRGVLVTGASGAIGAATVAAFAAEGARVAIHCFQNRESAEQLALETGGCVVQGDLRRTEDAARVMKEAVAKLGSVEVCVANSGRWEDEDVPLWEMTSERFNGVLEDNLLTAFLTCREFLRHVQSTGRGDIVLVSSTSAVFGEAGNADYAAAKAAIAFGLARTLKNEIVRIAPEGRVNVVAPGWTLTEAVRTSLDPQVLARASATMPLKKFATPAQVASAIIWLASSAASGHCSGQILTVAGGMEGRLIESRTEARGQQLPQEDR